MLDVLLSGSVQKVYAIMFGILLSLLAPSSQTDVASPTVLSEDANVVVKQQTNGTIVKKKVESRITPGGATTTDVAITNSQVSSDGVQEDSVTYIQDGYLVTDVVDGDTIKVNIDGTIETIRIIGINTPETVDPRRPVQCFGKQASDKAKELLVDQYVTLERDTTQDNRDKYGRLLRFVFINGDDYGKGMIREGYAYEYTYNTPYKYQKDYKEAQARAKSEGSGLWESGVCNESNKTVSSQTTQDVASYYTSSKSSAKNYYPSYCSAWRNLSATYLQSFFTLEELLSVYPSRVLSKQCE